jgi:hypothetical protein
VCYDTRNLGDGMSVLANLLPGVRAVRTPLAVGLLWLLTLWIALEPTVPTSSEASGVLESLERLEPVLSAIGALACISFAAYVVGAVYLTAVGALARVTVMVTDMRQGFLPMDRAAARELNLTRGDFRSRSARLPPLPLEVNHRLMRYVESRLDEAARTSTENEPKARVAESPGDPPAQQHADVSPADATQTYDERAGAAQSIVHMIRVQEWERLPLTIVGERPELYTEIDRFQSEADFRSALIGPIAGLLLTVGVRSGAVGPMLIAAVGALLVGALLRAASRDAAVRANTIIAHAIVADLIRPQTLLEYIEGRGEFRRWAELSDTLGVEELHEKARESEQDAQRVKSVSGSA